MHRYIALLLGILALLPGVARAQNVMEYARPGYPTITLFVWRPGVSSTWKVEDGIGLIELMSVAGVSSVQSEPRVKTVLKVYRETSGTRQEVYEGQVDKILASVTPPPTLQDKDVLVFEPKGGRRNRITLSQIGSVVYLGTSVIYLLFQLKVF